jgi:hypothetical protein
MYAITVESGERSQSRQYLDRPRHKGCGGFIECRYLKDDGLYAEMFCLRCGKVITRRDEIEGDW